MCFDAETVVIPSILMTSRFLHGFWCRVVTQPYYLTGTFDLTLSDLVTSVRVDLKVHISDMCCESTIFTHLPDLGSGLISSFPITAISESVCL